MAKVTFGEFTSKAGNTFPTLPVATVCDAINAYLAKNGSDYRVGGIGARGDAVLLFPVRAPKSKAAIQDERASKGAAGPAVSLTDMQAQLAALMALVQGGAIPTAPPAPVAKPGRRKAG